MKQICIAAAVLMTVFLASCAQEMGLKGHVWVEDPSVPVSWEDDAWYDYMDAPSGVTIRSGEIETSTDSSGNFTLTGKLLEGEILVSASASGYQTAYVIVEVDDIENEGYTTSPEAEQQVQLISGGNFSFYNTEYGYSTRSENVDLGESVITILLLKSPSGGSWDVFEYAP